MPDKGKVYRSKEFAKVAGMTKRALRYYNEQGILKPAFVNEAGHRFYTEDNFFEAQRILSLRFLMFSVEEIKAIQKSHSNMEESLKLQRRMLKEKESQIRAIIETIDAMENSLRNSGEAAWEDIFNAVKLAKYNMVRDTMMEYYNQRAKEYEEIFEGGGPADFTPDNYASDLKELEEFMNGFGRGRLIDIACGSGYWMKYYYKKCTSFTFLDQSMRMLKECKSKAGQYRILNQSVFMNADILEYECGNKEQYDCAVIGFLIGHFTKAQEKALFEKLGRILKRGSEILIIDSTWTRKRAEKQNKEDIEVRRLNDGSTYKIYKKYFDRDELAELIRGYGFTVKDTYFGNTFTAVSGVLG